MYSPNQPSDFQDFSPDFQNESYFIIKKTYEELLELPELRLLKEHQNSSEFFFGRINQVFNILLNNQRQALIEKFQRESAELEDYCLRLQENRIDLTFHNDQNLSQEQPQMRDMKGRRDSNSSKFRGGQSRKAQTEEKKQNKVYHQQSVNSQDVLERKMLLQECEKLQKYSLELEMRVRDADQLEQLRYQELLDLQNRYQNQEEQMRQSNGIVIQIERTLNLERENNKKLVLGTVQKYKEKIKLMKCKLEEYQVVSQLQNQQMNEFQLQDNEDKNMYQKQIQQIESQIENVQQHYETVIANIKEKHKEEIEKLKDDFLKDCQVKELEEKQMISKYELNSKNREIQQQDKFKQEFDNQQSKYQQLIDKCHLEFKVQLENQEREGKAQFNQLQESLRQKEFEASTNQKRVDELSTNIELMTQNKVNLELQIKNLLSEKEAYQLKQETHLKNQEQQKKIEEVAMKAEESKQREFKSVQALELALKMEEKNKNVISELEQQIERERDSFKKYKKILKLKLEEVLESISDLKERLQITQNQLDHKLESFRNWNMRQILQNHSNQQEEQLTFPKESLSFFDSKNSLFQEYAFDEHRDHFKTQNRRSRSVNYMAQQREEIRRQRVEADSRIELLETVKEQDNVIGQLKMMLLKAEDTEEECTRLREITVNLQRQIQENKEHLLESDQILRENKRLARQNSTLRQESEKLSISLKQLIEENIKLRDKLKVKKERTTIQALKEQKNIQEIQKMILNSYNSLRNRGIQQQQINSNSSTNKSANHNNNQEVSPQKKKSINLQNYLTRLPFSQISDTLKNKQSNKNNVNAQNKFKYNNEINGTTNNSCNISTSLHPSHQINFNQTHLPFSSQRGTPSTSIPFSSQRETPSQSFNKSTSIQSSRSPSRQNLPEHKQQQESFQKILESKMKIDYESEKTALKLNYDNQNIINNLSKLQQLDQFLQRSKSQSTIHNPSPLNDTTFSQADFSIYGKQNSKRSQNSAAAFNFSQPKTIQITSTFGQHSDRLSDPLIQGIESNQFQQFSPTELRRSQSFNSLIKK